ncbi:T9SS type A sorting domain-containing protein [Candidatus Poribacteria bacterium]|nr:T9SS type A sorting domain-containing protein [Candidatus Poribacteria bacterium]
MKSLSQIAIRILTLCCLFGMLHASWSSAEELIQEVSVSSDGTLTLPLGISSGATFSLVFDTISITGTLFIAGTNLNENVTSDNGVIEGGPYEVTLEPGEYILTETYVGIVSASNSLIGAPSIEIPLITFERPISVSRTATYSIEMFTTLQDLSLHVEGPFVLEEDSFPGVVGSVIVITLTTTADIQKGEVIEYVTGFTAIAVSDTFIESTSEVGDDESGEPPGEEPPDEEPPDGEMPGDGKGKPPKPPKEKPDRGGKRPDDRGASVIQVTYGVIDLGPMPLTFELPIIRAEPVDITATLTGSWHGTGTLIVTPSGVESNHIRAEAFEGRLEIHHKLEGIDSPIVVYLEAENVNLTEKSRSAESPLDLFLRAKTVRLIHPVTGEEIPWLEDLLGPLPNRIKIKDGELQFLKSSGTSREIAEEAADEAEAAAEEAELNASEASKRSVKAAQQLARNATAAAERAAEKAEYAAQKAQQAAEEAVDEASRKEAEEAEKAAERAQQAAEKAEEAAKKAGKEATDLNDDGANDIFDLVTLVQNFGKSADALEEAGIISDVNGDGNVDLFDLILVAQSMSGDGVLLPSTESASTPVAPGGNPMPNPNVWLEMVSASGDASGNALRMNLMADGITELYAFQFELRFDEGTIDEISIEEGSLLSSDGADTYWRVEEPPSGQNIGAISTRLTSKGISGIGHLASVTLQPNAERWKGEKLIKTGTIRIVDANANLTELTLHVRGLLAEQAVMPRHPELLQNYPNPFNPETWIPYELSKASVVTIVIYDAQGKHIRTLDLGTQPASSYLAKDAAAYWNGRNDTGERVSSGTYFYHFQADDFSATRKMIILK